MEHSLTLYSYWRSTAAYRVRIALNLLELEYRIEPVHLVHDGGQQHSAEYADINPQEMVPTLRDGRRVYTQSLAIMEYLDERYADGSRLLPNDPRDRARARALAQLVACEIHPIGNLRVLQYLESELHADPDQRKQWSRHWIESGFRALEILLADHPDTGEFCQGDIPGLADACLVPQVYNANRWGVDMQAFPTIGRINAACLALEPFQRASPEQQPDAP
ncbi:MAG: maleylacetoacetate isomerase [Rhodanobacteraceae bacterium]